VHVDLSCNDLGDLAAEALANGMPPGGVVDGTATRWLTLSLFRNAVGTRGALALHEAARAQGRIQRLDLGCNMVADRDLLREIKNLCAAHAGLPTGDTTARHVQFAAGDDVRSAEEGAARWTALLATPRRADPRRRGAADDLHLHGGTSHVYGGGGVGGGGNTTAGYNNNNNNNTNHNMSVAMDADVDPHLAHRVEAEVNARLDARYGRSSGSSATTSAPTTPGAARHQQAPRQQSLYQQQHSQQQYREQHHASSVIPPSVKRSTSATSAASVEPERVHALGDDFFWFFFF
jgi:hypothetical protein